jgi:hypothetical protein
MSADERGGDTIFAILFVVPFMLVLVFALVDIGVMFSSRYAVTNVLRDATRGVAAYGGNGPFPYAPPPSDTVTFSRQAENRLNESANQCRFGPCSPGRVRVQCGRMTEDGRYLGPTATAVGDTVGCRISSNNGRYPYKSVVGGLLNTPLGVGMGRIVQPFTAWVTARAEQAPNGGNPNVN